MIDPAGLSWQKSVEAPQKSAFHLLSQGRKEAAWPSDQCIGLTIQRSQGWVPLWPLARFVLGLPAFKSLAILVNSHLDASDPFCWGFNFCHVLLMDYLLQNY